MNALGSSIAPAPERLARGPIPQDDRPLERLLSLLGGDGDVQQWSLRRWSDLIASARARRLLGELASEMRTRGARAPAVAQRHLDGALQLAQRQNQSVQWELHCLDAAFDDADIPIVLLKGAAYAIKGLALARGRLFGDIDILVPRESLGLVETRLMVDGWVSAKPSPYDQRYYREWMHELPPMQHMQRGTVLDVHHTILPLTARHAPDPAAIMARSTPIVGFRTLRMPAQEDLLVHSLTHLVHEGELDACLRDLYDVDSMVRTFSLDSGFWQRFVAASAGNDLAGPVWLGLTLAQRFFAAPVPDEVAHTLARYASPSWNDRSLIERYARALGTPDGCGGSFAHRWALTRIYLRSHALRMPLPLLVRHLSIKAWKDLWPKASPAEGLNP